MPAEDCPSFHWRPSTASSFLLPSFSMRQTPTTGTSDFGSAPAVSLVRSTLTGAANAGNSTAKTLTATISSAFVLLFMTTSLMNVEFAAGGRRVRHHARKNNIGHRPQKHNSAD